MKNLFGYKIFVLLITLFFLFPRPGLAYDNYTVLFEDSFTGINSSIWTTFNDGGTISVGDGMTLTSSNSRSFPYVYNSSNVIPTSEDYFIEIDYSFPEITHMGVGFGLGSAVPEYGVSQNTLPDQDLIQFQIWQSINDNYILQTNKCDDVNNCHVGRITLFNKTPNTERHKIKFEHRKNIFKIYHDGDVIESEYLEDVWKRPTVIWFGNNIKLQTNNNWTDLKIHKVKIGTVQSIPDPIVILPGLGASWDFGALIAGSDGGNWQIPSFIGVYNGLISSIENAGLSQSEPNKKLYIFGYDWRKPLDHVADKLKNYLDSNIPSETKIDLVGHSMGGLVARSYIQKYGIDRIDQVLTIGSPHYGSAKAYSVWEGGTVLDGSWWNKLALELTVHFGALDGEEKVDTVRRLSPSIKDLLPTYDYLAKDGLVVPELLMNHRNLYLHTLNDNFHGFDEVLTPFYSKSIEDTGYRISVYDPSDLELSRGLWVDGKPQDSDPYFYANGDGTVVDFSAKGPFSNNIELNGRHDEIVTAKNNIDRVLSFLNLDSSNSVAGVDDSRNRVFVAALKSPGKLSVCDKDTQLCDADLGVVVSDKLIFIPGFMGQQLKVSVSEDGLGEYALHLGNIDWKSEWVVINDALNREGENDIFEVSSDDNGEMSVYQQDNTPPSTPQITNLNNPSIACGGATKSDSVDVSWGESSDASGIKEYQLEIRYFENEIEKINNISTPDRFANAYIFEGKNYLKVRAVDNASNSSSWSDECLVTVDYAAPYIAISSPLNKTYSITTPPKLEYTVIDNADPSPEIVVSGWSTLVGNHTVVVTATDDVGNISSASVAYSIASNNNVPQICQGNNWRVFWMFGVRNQSQCVTFVNKYQKQITYILYLLRRHF